MNRYRKIVIFLRILILILLIFYITLKVYNHKINNYKSDFYNNFSKMLFENTIKSYNTHTTDILNELFDGRITVLNIYNINNINYLHNLKLIKQLKEQFININIIDVFLKDDSDILSNDIFGLIEDVNESFILQHNIDRPAIAMSSKLFEDYFNIKNIENKIILLDNFNNVKYIEHSNNIKIDSFIEKIETVSKHNKSIYNSFIGVDIEAINNKFGKDIIINNNNKNDNFTTNTDRDFIKHFKKFILIDKITDYEFPAFVMLDDNNIIITKLNGDILYTIDTSNYCEISGLKYINDELYITDICSGSINKINFKEQKIETIIKSKKLFGISDVELLDKSKLLISKKTEDGIGIFDIKQNTYNNLSNVINFEYKIGRVNRIVYKYNKYYYFDIDSNILYSYDYKTNTNKEEINLNQFENIVISQEIDNFYIHSKNNIYFLDSANYRILHYNDNKITEQSFQDLSYPPNDLLIYRNIYYILLDNAIQIVNLYNNDNHTMNFYFSNNRQNFFDINTINVNQFEQKQFTLKTNTLKINDIINDINIIPYSPSFLIVFEKNNNIIKPLKLFNYNSLVTDININVEKNKTYIIYGNMYYNTDNNIKIKNINFSISQ